MNKKKFSLGSFLVQNMVTIFFLIICVLAFIFSGISIDILISDLFVRIGRNAFLVLALVIPVLTGMGLNFSIVIGAIAAQIGLFIVANNGWTGIPGFLLAILFSVPIAIVFGFLVGALFNKMKGTETIGGLVLGYFSDGLYQFLFLFILGGIIPINNPRLSIKGSEMGVINSIDLKQEGLKYVLDNIQLISILDFLFYVIVGASLIAIVYNTLIKKKKIAESQTYIVALIAAVVVYGISFIPAVGRFLAADRLPLLPAIEIGVIIMVVYQILRILGENAIKIFKANTKSIKQRVTNIVITVLIYGLTYIPFVEKAFKLVQIPVMTYLCVAALCLFNSWIMKTKLGQNMRTVGQNRTVANADGINVDRTRIIAMIFSTVLACLGQLIYLQNLGTFQTYGAHTQVGLYAIASLLVGGASVQKANSKQAIIGVALFHTLAILSPLAGTALFNDPQIGEYFRRFVTYIVIAISLAMHVYNEVKKSSKKLSPDSTENSEPVPTAV